MTDIKINLPRAANPAADDFGCFAWTCDPMVGAGSTTGAVTGGTVYLNSVFVRKPVTATKVYNSVSVVGITLTVDQNFVGLYNAAGTRLAVSASMDVAWVSTGLSTATFTAPVALAPGMYWIAVVTNGLTQPAFRMATGGNLATFLAAANAGLSAASLRVAVNGTGATSLTTPITPASNSATGALAIWSALA